MKADILKHLEIIVSEISATVIPNIRLINNSTYENFFHSGKKSYAKRLGEELIKNNIAFESIYDIGYGHFEKDDKNLEFAKSYAEACKQTPNSEFLKNILPLEAQRSILLDTINHFDFGFPQDMNKLVSMLSILNEFKTIGVDKIHINKEITDIIKELAKDGKIIHPNAIVIFINNGFFFDEEFMNNDFKTSFKRVFVISPESQFHEVCCLNDQNRIKYNYYETNRLLPIKEENKVKKNKI